MTEPQNAEKIEVTFENKSGDIFRLRFNKFDKEWDISAIKTVPFHVCSFKEYSLANECAKLIKRSV